MQQVSGLDGHMVTDRMCLYDSLRKSDLQTKETRVMLDIEDMRQGVGQEDPLAWIPTGIMLADGLTKHLPDAGMLTRWKSGHPPALRDHADRVGVKARERQ